MLSAWRHRVAPETAAAVLRAVRAGVKSLKRLPALRLSEWAAEHFKMSSESSHTQGAWVAYPFQRGLLDFMSDDDIEELTVRKSKRVGYTKALLAFIGYNAAYRRRKQALWQPTDDDRDSFVKTEVEPMLRDVPALQAVRSLVAEETIKLKQFLGSIAHFLGGKAARAFRRITVAVSMLDEADGFDQMVEKSLDPITGAAGRLEGAPFPKLIAGSTPRVKGLSHVERREKVADVLMRYNVECPHCGVEHPLIWGGKKAPHGFKWDKGQPETAHHVCPHCRGTMTQGGYLAVWERGAWVCERTGVRYGQDGVWRDADLQPCRAPRHVAVHIWAAYSPQRSWESIARECLEARASMETGDAGPMQGFVNETLGELWEVKAATADESELLARRDPYRLGRVPVGCLVLVAGVDVQDTWFQVLVWGFGRGEEMWLVDRQLFEANPADERDWEKLDAYLRTRFVQDWHGGTLGIEAVGIDTGGHFTHQVYNFARVRECRRVLALRGSNRYGGPIKGKPALTDVNWRGQVIKGGVKLWEVGTDTAKDLIYARLKIVQPGPGRVHFPDDVPAEFFAQLTSEGRVLQKTSAGEQYRWVKRRVRNEDLDCTVYALFAAHVLDLHRYTSAMWDRLEHAVQPERDLFSPPPVAAQPAVAGPPPAPVQPLAPVEPHRRRRLQSRAFA